MQLVDLHERLQVHGISKHLVPQILSGTCGLTLGLSIWVTGIPDTAGEVQVVASVLNDTAFSLMLDRDGDLDLLPPLLTAVPPGRGTPGRQPQSDHHIGLGASRSGARSSGSFHPEIIKSPGRITAVWGPMEVPSNRTWSQLRFR